MIEYGITNEWNVQMRTSKHNEVGFSYQNATNTIATKYEFGDRDSLITISDIALMAVYRVLTNFTVVLHVHNTVVHCIGPASS